MNLDEAVVALQTHARQTEAIQAIAAAIKSAGDLDNLRAEREAALEAVAKRVVTAEADGDKRIANLKARIEAEEKRLGEVLSKIERAQADADASAARCLAEITGRRDALHKEVNGLEDRLAALNEQIKARSASLAEINSALDRTRKMLSASA